MLGSILVNIIFLRLLFMAIDHRGMWGSPSVEHLMMARLSQYISFASVAWGCAVTGVLAFVLLAPIETVDQAVSAFNLMVPILVFGAGVAGSLLASLIADADSKRGKCLVHTCLILFGIFLVILLLCVTARMENQLLPTYERRSGDRDKTLVSPEIGCSGWTLTALSIVLPILVSIGSILIQKLRKWPERCEDGTRG